MTHSISLVVATKDRPDDLNNLLVSMCGQSIPPAQIVIVDASNDPVEYVAKRFPNLNVLYLRHLPPSAAAQRNAGIQACSASSTLIGFADDDTTFEPDSFEGMMRFWDSADSDVLGASFNMLNAQMPAGQGLKHSRLVTSLGLYSSDSGGVAPSGWQSVTGRVAETLYVQWIASCAVIWRREALEAHKFDEYFSSYSYLEDVDLSYSIGRKGRLAIVAEVGYKHFPSVSGRVSSRQFGRIEVRNRLYFVRKHGLSIMRCVMAIGIRLTMTLLTALRRWDGQALGRALGNVEALAEGMKFVPRASACK